MKLEILSGLCLCLIGCGSVVPSTLMAMRGLSPLEADPAGFVTRVTVPDQVRIVPGSARLILQAERADTKARREGTFVLDETLADGATLYRVAPRDLARLRALQSEINAWETLDPEATTGSLSVSVTACRLVEIVPRDATVSVDLQLTEAEPFLPLLSNAPLASILTDSELTALVPCT